MHITVLLGLSVLLVVSLTVNGFTVQEEADDDTMLEVREVDDMDDAETIFYVSEILRDLENEMDDEDM